MKAKQLEKMFDEGKDVTPYLDLSKARRPGHEQRRVNVDFSQLDHRIPGRASKPPWRHKTIGDQAMDRRAIEGRTIEGQLSFRRASVKLPVPIFSLQAMKVTRQQLYNVMRGNSAVSPDMALRLEKAFGCGAR